MNNSMWDLAETLRGIPGDVRQLSERDIDTYISKEEWDKCQRFISKENGGIFLVTDATIDNIFYSEYENGVYIPLTVFSEEFFGFIGFEERVRMLRERQLAHLESKEYELFYHNIPETMKLFDFERRHVSIDNQSLSNTFKSLYSTIDFGFCHFPEGLLRALADRIQTEDSDEIITIYRGEGRRSAHLGYSWTTNPAIARKFATVNHEEGTVYQAQVKKRDILFYIDDRNEDEVIILPENLFNIKKEGGF